MKKSLIALAALSITGAAFAQVSITGTLGVSLQKSSALTTTSASQGLQVTDGHVNFTATEDLGGGYKAIASSEVLLRGRETAVAARDASVTLVTPSFTLTGGAVEVGPLIGNAWAGAPASFTDGPDGIVMDGYMNVDALGVSVPMGPVSLSWTHLEVNSPLSATVAGNQSTVRGEKLAASYASGALAIDVAYTMLSANKAVQALYDDHTKLEIAGTYDLGVAKVGLGYQAKNHSIANQYAVGIAAPIGSALTVGLTYTGRDKQDAVAAYGVGAEDARSGTTLGLSYNLSKLTNISAQYAVYSGMGANDVSTTKADNEYRIRLQKSF